MSDSGALVMGLDIGTSGVKGVLCAHDGQVLAHVREQIRLSRPQPGHAEHDPHRWWDALRTIVGRLLAGEPGSRARLAGLGISGVCPVVVPVDRHGRALRPAIMYSIDERATTEIGELGGHFDAAEVYRRSGQSLGTQNLLAKAMWLRTHEPLVWQDTWKLLGSTSYLLHRLTGAIGIDHFSAADGGLGYHLDSRTWDTEVFDVAGLDPALMPSLRWPTEVAGTVHADAAEATGLPEGTPVVVGTGDALADLVATGATTTGDGALLYGTSMSTMVLASRPSRSAHVVNVPGWRPGQLVQSAILPTGIGIFEWWARWVGSEWSATSLREASMAIAGSEPGAGGLMHLPYLAGGRWNSPDGALLGIRAAHRTADRYRAIAEGLAHALRAQLAGSEVPRDLRVIGAGAEPEIVQIVSDVCGFRQSVLHGRLDASVGVARLTAEGLGIGSPATWQIPTTVHTPAPELREFYDRQQQRFDDFTRQLAEAGRLSQAKEGTPSV